MIDALRTALVARVTELTADLRFSHKPSGAVKIAPQVVNGSLEPPRPGDWEEAGDYPFVRVALYRGSFHDRMPLPCEAVLYGGIWTPGTVQDGDDDIFTLLKALGRIVEEPRFPPWLLSEACPWTVGLQDQGFEGMQRHPFHYGAVFLEFTTPTRG